MRLLALILCPLVAFAGELPRLEWDAASQRLLVPGGVYGRMHVLPNGHLLVCSQLRQTVIVLRSEDQAQTWSQPVEVARHEHGIAANPELCVLRDGRVIALWNERPAKHGTEHAFTIRMSLSADGGHTWQPRAEPIYLARLPSGETLLSVQTNLDELRWHRMAVYVGDEHARAFTHLSLPFGLPPETNSEWNSLCVIDADQIIALTSTRIRGQSGLWMVRGKVTTATPP